MRDREGSFDIRRWWFVPFAVLLVVVFFRARPAGYITTTSPSTTADATSIAAAASADTTAEPTASAVVASASGTAIPEDRRASAVPPSAEPFTTTLAAFPTIVPLTPTAEPPALAPEVAPPTAPTFAPAQPTPVLPAEQPAPPAQQPAPAAEATQRFPTRLRIPAIDLDLKPIAVGLDGNRVPVVPKHDAGWYAASAIPGDGSNIVFWGHVLRWLDSPNVAAPFVRLQELQPGATVEITLANGEQYSYRVTQQIQARPEDVQYILPTDGERVTLVSCVGDKVIREGVLTKEFRLITIAEPL